MSGNIQLGNVRPAATGTGILLNSYRLSGDQAKYVENNAAGVPATLNLKRTEPIATKDYAGAGRGEVKFTRVYTDAAGRQWPAVFTVSSSIPAFLTAAQKDAFILEASIAGVTPDSIATLAHQLVPQT